MKLFGRGGTPPAPHVGGPAFTPSRILFAAFALVGVYFAFRLAINLAQLWVMMFGAVVVAVLLRSVADPIIRLTRAPPGLAVGGALIFILGLLVGAIALFGAQISAQVTDLAARLPLGWARFEALIESQPYGAQLTATLESLSGRMGQYAERAFAAAQGVIAGVGAALTGLLLVMVAGLYLALSPSEARDGLTSLFPKARRERVRHVLNTCGRALKGWLRAQLLSMVVVGLLCGVGLAVIGVPSAVALGVLTAILDFVPIVGPIAATIPAVLMGATVGWQEALLTLGLYFVVQQVESVLILPLAQKNVAQLPVIVTVFSVVAFGGLFGPAGVLLSAPMALTLYVLVIMIYRQDVLKDEDARAPGER